MFFVLFVLFLVSLLILIFLETLVADLVGCVNLALVFDFEELSDFFGL